MVPEIWPVGLSYFLFLLFFIVITSVRVPPLSLRGYEGWATCGQNSLTGSPQDSLTSFFTRGRYSPNRYIFFLDLEFQSVKPFPISLLVYLLYSIQSSNQYVKLKMKNSFNLSLFKLRISKKCITFEPKLRFTKFKSLNWSEFHQELEFLPNFWKGTFLSSILDRE